MPDPTDPDPTGPLSPVPGGAAQHRDGKRIGLLALSVLLLMFGAGLVYASLTLRWGYFDTSARPLTASDLKTLTSTQRATMTVWWGDSMMGAGCWCGPLPVLWPALAFLSALPLIVAAMRQHTARRWWSRFGLLCAACGFANVWVTVSGIRMAGEFNDGGWLWAADNRTVAIALSGYVLLALGVLVLAVLTHATPFALASTRPTPPAGG